MRLVPFLSAICLLLGSVNCAVAQSQHLMFDHITVEEGLSQSTVFSITQDAEGFMWFATREGLNRYDSRDVVVYHRDPLVKTSLSDNTIYSLLADKEQRLWIGTRNGLNQYNPLTDGFKHYFSIPENPRSLSNNTISCVFEDRHHNIWVGTRGGLNLMVIKDSVEFIRFTHNENEPNTLVNDDVRSVFEDSDGALWIGTSHGFSKLLYNGPDKFKFTSFDAPGENARSDKSNWVNAITEDGNGNLLIGTEKNGLRLFDKKKARFIEDSWKESDNLEYKAVRTILKDPEGTFWIGTIGGLYIIDEKTGVSRKLHNIPDNPYSISDNSVRSIFMDRDGSYWIGTFHGGVNIYSPFSKQFRHIKPGMDWPKLRFKIASALLTDSQENVWLGTEGNGLLCIDRTNNTSKHFKHDERDNHSLSHDNIKCLLLDGNKGLWIGTIKGLDFYDFRKQKFYHYSLKGSNNEIILDDAIYGLTKGEDGNIWVATYRAGLARFNPTTGVFEETFSYSEQDSSTISSDGVTTVLIDSKKDLWVGTISGFNKMERESKRFIRFMNEPGKPASISGEYVHCIYEDTNGHIWVGTRGKGLNMMMDDGKSFRHFTTEDGLPGNSIYGILEDERGYLWLSTENGLSRFDPQTLTCKNFNRDDGLVCKEFNFNSYYKDERYMYFGGYNGIVYFDPANIKGNGVVPTLAFTRLKLFNKEIRTSDEKDAVLPQRLNHTEELEFRYHQNVFSVEFAVLNYINARKNQFAYRLEGFEDQWNYVKEPVATYMNLKPGHYTLQVKGANNDGVWNEKPLRLAIHILPPPWKTWWAYSIYLTLFLALLYTWSRFNKRQVQLEHELQIEHLEKQKQEELHQAKLNFFTNIAHEIRTPLTLMVGPVDQLSERLQQDAYLKKEIGLVKTNSDRLLRLLNQLLDFQKQETGNVRLKVRKENFVEFIREIQVPFQEFAESRKISMHLHTQETSVPLWFDKEELSKVFYNLLANAFKFTPGGGKVLIGITKEENQDPAGNGESYRVKITIEDNGLGIAASQLERIFHRFYQAENTGVHEAGFGIGLALAKGIIDLHHGEITVESQEATHDIQGFTRFTIWLMGGNTHFDKEQRCTEEKLPEIGANEEITLAAEAPERSSNDPYLVLVVEDNEDIRRYIRDTLRHHHYEVLESSNGQEGWQTAIDKLPDLVLSDVMMSGMNGLDLVTKIKSDVRTSHIPVILLTARASVNHQVEGLVTGADDYITKPFNNQLLLVKIKNHLEIREKLKEKYSKIVTLQPQQDEVEDPDDRFLRKLMEVLETNLLDPEFNVTRLVREIGMSRPVLFRKTKMLTGLSVIDLIRSVRLKKAEMLLKQCKLSVSEVAFAVGFSDPKYFSKSFKDQYGKSPSQFMEEIANNSVAKL